MALLPGELQRVRFELGFNVLSAGAEPYISYVAVFDKVIQIYLNSGPVTTSSTAVVVSTTGSPVPVAITLADPTGFTNNDQVVVDVDDRQEIVTGGVAGSTLLVALSKAHSGTYAVSVESGEAIVRECLLRIREVKGQMASTFGSGAIKKVDEVEFYDLKGKALFGMLGNQLSFWRSELASALGMPDMWAERRACGQMTSGY